MFQDILDAFIEGIKTVFFWFLDLIATVLSPLFESLLEGFPSLVTTVQTASELIAYINFFVPLDYGFLLLTFYFGFLGLYTAIKLPVKYFIPTLG